MIGCASQVFFSTGVFCAVSYIVCGVKSTESESHHTRLRIASATVCLSLHHFRPGALYIISLVLYYVEYERTTKIDGMVE